MSNDELNIGTVSKLSGVHHKMIRYYEKHGLLPKKKRSDAGYRKFTERDVHLLIFIKHLKELGFSSGEIKKMVGLWLNKSRSSADVKAIAQSHIVVMQSKIKNLEALLANLTSLVKCCEGGVRPDCPILENLSQNKPKSK